MQKNIELNVTASLCGSLLRSRSLQVRIQTEITPQLCLFVSACEHAASCQVTIQHCHPPKWMNISCDTSLCICIFVTKSDSCFAFSIHSTKQTC